MRIHYPPSEVGVVVPTQEQPPAQLERIVQREPISFADDELLKAFGAPRDSFSEYDDPVRQDDRDLWTDAKPKTVVCSKGNVSTTYPQTDDLTKINGIGPTFSSRLYQAGINTFDKLAESPIDVLKSAIGDSPYPDYILWKEEAYKFVVERSPTYAPVPSTVTPVSEENIKVLDLLQIAALDVKEVEVVYDDFDNDEIHCMGVAVIDKFNGITSIFLDEIICLNSSNAVSIEALRPYDMDGQYFIHGIEYIDDQGNSRTIASDQICVSHISWYLVE
jgi:hypothetical protein